MIPEKKDVVIIGNGPSAITLSYILDGNWPFYCREHPNEELHARLQSLNLFVREDQVQSNSASSVSHSSCILSIFASNFKTSTQNSSCCSRKGSSTSRLEEKSLIRSPLEYICSGLEGRSINPVSVLLDSLQHPEADFGSEIPSCLMWRKIPGKEVDHVVLGQEEAGGSWSRMSRTGCDDILTVSFAQWMQLPDCPVTGTMKGTSGKRINLGNVAKYYKSYIQRKGLDKYFRDHSTVTGLKFIEKNKHWKVSGWQEGKGNFEYITKRVVLATGNSDFANRLSIEGEDLPFVFHSISDLERILNDAKNRVLTDDPVVIVGSGLTAADAILTCKEYAIPVKHVFRRHPEDPALIFNQLPENLYPEYHMVHDSMKGSHKTPGFDYKTFPMHSLTEIRKNKEVVLTNLLGVDDAETSSRTTIKASYVLVLIGKRPDLSFILNKNVRDQLPVFPGESLSPRSNPIRIEPYSHRCPSLHGLYAMGPLVGDNFVRFVQGAALAICHDIWDEKEDKKKTQKNPLIQVR